MGKYASGQAILKYEKQKTEVGRVYCDFVVFIPNNINFSYTAEDYSCPTSWTKEDMVKDMFGWALDSSEGKELSKYVKMDNTEDSENVVLMEKI